MRATAASGFADTVANTFYVDTVGDFFKFKAGSTATPVANVVVPSSDGLGQFHRMGIPNQTFLSASFWSLDPANSTGRASDENAGWGVTQAAADLVPLLTMAELKRRTAGARYAGTVVFHQMSAATTGETLDISTVDGNGYPVWVGTKSQVYPSSGTVALTTYTAANPAGNAGVQISLTSLPTSFTASGLVGMFIESADGTRIARVLKDLGTKTARITTPCNPDIVNASIGTAQVFTNGEQVRFVTFSRLPCAPFPSRGISYAGVTDVSFEPSIYEEYDFGTVNMYVARAVAAVGASFKAAGTVGGNNIGCVGFGNAATSTDVYFTGGIWATAFCGAIKCVLTPQASATLLANHAPLDLQASRVAVTTGGMFTGFGPESVVSAFDTTLQTFSTSGPQAGNGVPFRFNPTTAIYGTGNTSYIFAVLPGQVALVPSAANCYVATSFAHPLLFGVAVVKDFADLPYMDLTQLCGMASQ